MTTKKRNFKGFGVVTRQGRFLWQYSRPEADQTRQAYERHNPQIDGLEGGYELVRVSLQLEPIE